MTEFTKEYIRSVRMCSYLMEPPASEVIEHLCDEIERLQQRIAELEQATMWTPVSKPVEGNNLEILCYSNEAPHYESYFAIYIDGIFGEYESGKFLEVFPKPTHYMYKPKPPKYKPPQPPKEGE